MGKHTSGPYRLTLKSNGCLILISALSPRHVLVASKHSLGTTTEAEIGVKESVESVTQSVEGLSVNDQNKNGKKDKKQKGKEQTKDDVEEDREAEAHAEVGRRWLKRTLEKVGKTEAELAKRLWDSNTTAVLEVSVVNAAHHMCLLLF